ncbi:hypothetical protein STIAU_7247 [Stigmatella aurantiaca DW4/3-1]|uniref:Uncharacterized protein n=1 Tax=Stigmatella aurantiaca (strain DW4/3-1) TaxID=378806 RepID=Q08P84_STIAD|nr:hypothetical protein STIAU_7247 [Stigmatella aurantiaca DW4/3-1]
MHLRARARPGRAAVRCGQILGGAQGLFGRLHPRLGVARHALGGGEVNERLGDFTLAIALPVLEQGAELLGRRRGVPIHLVTHHRQRQEGASISIRPLGTGLVELTGLLHLADLQVDARHGGQTVPVLRILVQTALERLECQGVLTRRLV